MPGHFLDRLCIQFLAIGLFLAFAADSLAQGVVLTEQQALALFYERNMDLIAARYNLDQTKAEEIIAAAIPNPVFSLDVEELSPNNNAGQGPATIARIDQLIETAGKRRLRVEKSTLATQAAEGDLRDAVRVFSNAVRHSFYGLLLAQKSAELARDNLKRYQPILRANRLRLKAGDISESDFLRIEVEALKSQSDLDNTEAELKKACSELAVLLAWPERAMNFIAQDHWPEPKDIGQSQGEEALLKKALAQRPDLQAAKLRIDQSQKELSLARKLRIPDVTVGLSYAHDPGTPFLDTAGVGISLPLPLFYRNQGEIGKAEVNLNNAELEAQKVEQDARADVVSALAVWESAETIIQRFTGAILDRVTRVRRTAELAYSKGSTGILDMIQAERDYNAAMLEYYKALANRTLAYADLLKASGEESGILRGGL
jgi:cobalt-zinc-cadmium efflux system outer membrane protein